MIFGLVHFCGLAILRTVHFGSTEPSTLDVTLYTIDYGLVCFIIFHPRHVPIFSNSLNI